MPLADMFRKGQQPSAICASEVALRARQRNRSRGYPELARRSDPGRLSIEEHPVKSLAVDLPHEEESPRFTRKVPSHRRRKKSVVKELTKQEKALQKELTFALEGRLLRESRESLEKVELMFVWGGGAMQQELAQH